MNVQRGDIVLVDFPYSDQTGYKVRPALVVQSNVWNLRLALPIRPIRAIRVLQIGKSL